MFFSLPKARLGCARVTQDGSVIHFLDDTLPVVTTVYSLVWLCFVNNIIVSCCYSVELPRIHSALPGLPAVYRMNVRRD